jgi:hypothetical protein
MTILLCKKNTAVKSKEVHSRWSNSQECTNLAESSMEGYGSKRTVLPMKPIIVIVVTVIIDEHVSNAPVYSL